MSTSNDITGGEFAHKKSTTEAATVGGDSNTKAGLQSTLNAMLPTTLHYFYRDLLQGVETTSFFPSYQICKKSLPPHPRKKWTSFIVKS
jgi:hypothetical protein